MGSHRINKPSKKKAAASAGLITAVAGTIIGTAGSASASVSSSYITSQPHSVQRACAQRIYAAQGSGAWTGWAGSLDNMSHESGNNDHAVNTSSGAAGYYQIMPGTWSYLCGDLSGSSSSASSSTTYSSHTTTRSYSSHATTKKVTTQKVTLKKVTSRKTTAPVSPAFGHYVFSSYVQSVQHKLIAKGYSVGVEGADGLLGPHTWAGIVAFQKAHGLAVDGVPGPHTWAALTS